MSDDTTLQLDRLHQNAETHATHLVSLRQSIEKLQEQDVRKPGGIIVALRNLSYDVNQIYRYWAQRSGYQSIEALIRAEKAVKEKLFASTRIVGPAETPCPLCGSDKRRVEEILWTGNTVTHILYCLDCGHTGKAE